MAVRKDDLVRNAGSKILMKVQEVKGDSAYCWWPYFNGVEEKPKRMAGWFKLADLSTPPNPMLVPAPPADDAPAQKDKTDE